MARSSRARVHRKRPKNRRQQEFTAQNHAQRVVAARNAERHKEEQLLYLKRMSELKRSILARTLFINHVCAERLFEIRQYFHTTFGPVEDCLVAKKKLGRHQKRRNGPPSSIHVRFQIEADAQRALSRKGDFPSYLLSKPHGGSFYACQAHEYQGMLKTVVEGTEISIVAYRLALGHYFPRHDFSSPQSDVPDQKDNAWLEELHLEGNVNMRIDVVKRTIELTLPSYPKKEYAFIRFKELFGPIELCRGDREGRYCLLLPLKFPPKLYTDDDDEDRDPVRNMSFGSLNAESFGRCGALRLDVEETGVVALLLSKGLKTLRSFGILHDHVQSVDDAENFVRHTIGSVGAAEHKKVLYELALLQQQDSTIGTRRLQSY
jgi:hypothetical protein